MSKGSPASADVLSTVQHLFPSARVDLAKAAQATARRADYVLAVALGGQRLDLLVESKSVISEAGLRDAAERFRARQGLEPSEWWVLAAPFFSPSRQDVLRGLGVPFFDLAGNAWLVGDAVHVDRRGFANPFVEERGSRNPFSDKASLVLRALIEGGPRRGIRAIAGEVDLSPGYVSKVVQELERRGYAARLGDGIALRRGEELLVDWAAAYRRRVVAAREYFVPASSAAAVMEALRCGCGEIRDDYALTLQAGARLVHPLAEFDSVDAYVRSGEAGDALAEALGAREVERGANLRLSEPYYRVSAFYGVRIVQELPVVSDLQLWLDLYDYPLRGREQAERILERGLRPQLEKAERG